MSRVRSLQHCLQVLHPTLNFLLQVREIGKDLLRRAMLNLLVHQFLVPVEREIVALSGDVRFRYTKALGGSRPFLEVAPVI